MPPTNSSSYSRDVNLYFACSNAPVSILYLIPMINEAWITFFGVLPRAIRTRTILNITSRLIPLNISHVYLSRRLLPIACRESRFRLSLKMSTKSKLIYFDTIIFGRGVEDRKLIRTTTPSSRGNDTLEV